MIDRFLVRIANAHSFLSKLWVLARPYWFAEERQAVGLWGYSVMVKEAWVACGLLTQVMTVATFAVVLWSLSGGIVLPIFGGIAVPGYMMWAAIAYALVGTWATYLIGRPLVRVNFQLERYNADFRYRMVRIREN